MIAFPSRETVDDGMAMRLQVTFVTASSSTPRSRPSVKRASFEDEMALDCDSRYRLASRSSHLVDQEFSMKGDFTKWTSAMKRRSGDCPFIKRRNSTSTVLQRYYRTGLCTLE